VNDPAALLSPAHVLVVAALLIAATQTFLESVALADQESATMILRWIRIPLLLYLALLYFFNGILYLASYWKADRNGTVGMIAGTAVHITGMPHQIRGIIRRAREMRPGFRCRNWLPAPHGRVLVGVALFLVIFAQTFLSMSTSVPVIAVNYLLLCTVAVVVWHGLVRSDSFDITGAHLTRKVPHVKYGWLRSGQRVEHHDLTSLFRVEIDFTCAQLRLLREAGGTERLSFAGMMRPHAFCAAVLAAACNGDALPARKTGAPSVRT
jgi:hypothetical protein